MSDEAKMNQKIIPPLLAWVLILAVWPSPPSQEVFRSFVKLEDMRLPYAISFFLSLPAIILFFKYTKTWHPIWIFSSSILLSQIASTASLTLANFFIPSGLERARKAIAQTGVVDILIDDFVVSLVIGSWLSGAVIAAIIIVTGRPSPTQLKAQK
ncbi:hypothetical protein [Lysobacter sp. 1R34A]|uniref:hypothetical protein n=1 Tax=Lysobacter sp. 1R34A TaxID=3445786 RepID=UPI003EEDBE9D